jgi:CRISPR/Cas system CSM-associated protein Csm3 (group 7 of RAMP superfamily)
MPQGENFWNPYRWVTVHSQPIEHAVPHYHHASNGLSGRLRCELEALTPLLIGDGHGEFVRHRHDRQPYIPATSLKGALRSLAEVVGNAAAPFPNQPTDPWHGLDRARTDTAVGPQFDTVARTFGYLYGGNVFAGLIHFSDATMESPETPPSQWPKYKVAVGQPKSSHRAFYPGNNRRKFYHHHPGATYLVRPASCITQTVQLRPAPPGTRFSFTVDFANLRAKELNLLLYCLVLEEQASVTLSQAALAPGAQGPVTLQGPLRHKIGGAKPHGAGSVHIRITKMALRADATARYRGQDSVETWEEDTITDELARRTASFRSRTDVTIRELRAMLIYDVQDPRREIKYPTYEWFQRKENTAISLKPTL